MREELQSQEGVRATFRGTVARFGTKTAYHNRRVKPLADIPTVMLRDVTDKTGKVVSDHLWMTQGVQIKRLNIQEGDIVEFDARVTQYIKGYQGYREDVYKPIETDYRLSNPTKVRKVEKEVELSGVNNAS